MKSILHVLDGQDLAIVAGGYSIHQFEPGKYWLENPDGEGMETSEERVKAMLKEFFEREF
jgi:hypothetical protein